LIDEQELLALFRYRDYFVLRNDRPQKAKKKKKEEVGKKKKIRHL